MTTIFPELVRCARANEEERLALLAHRYFGSGAPLSTRAEYESMLAKAGILLFYESDMDGYGAMLVRDERDPASPIFCIKKDLDWMEQKFLIANLLGRFLFDYQVKAISNASKVSDFKEAHSPYQRFLVSKRPRHSQMSMQVTRLEWLADEFAGAFIVPKPWLRIFVEEVEKDPYRIAAHFSISIEFLHARIKHIRQKYQQASTPGLQKLGSKFPHRKSNLNPVSRIRDLARKIDPIA
jgi:hypothetical protein